MLEKVMAETQSGQVAMQLGLLKNELEVSLLRFRLLLNTVNILVPSMDVIKLEYSGSAAAGMEEHPQAKWYMQQQRISAQNTKLERSKLLPDLVLGYSNQSMQGTGADNRFYSGASRFGSVYGGIGIPLFFGSQKARISSAKTLEQIAGNNYQQTLHSLNSEYQQALKEYEAQQKALAYFESVALKNAETITNTADKQFADGGINYLEWALLVNNATTIQNNYIEALCAFNKAVILLNYLNSK